MDARPRCPRQSSEARIHVDAVSGRPGPPQSPHGATQVAPPVPVNAPGAPSLPPPPSLSPPRFLPPRRPPTPLSGNPRFRGAFFNWTLPDDDRSFACMTGPDSSPAPPRTSSRRSSTTTSRKGRTRGACTPGFRPSPTATCTSATPSPSASTSAWRPSTAASATCATTTPTPAPRTWSMSNPSKRMWPGWASAGTASRSMPRTTSTRSTG